MINNLLKLSTLIVTGRFLKPRIKGLLLLASAWIIVWLLHGEYINYVELSEDKVFLWQAAVIKLFLYLLSATLYYFIVEKKLINDRNNKGEGEDKDTLSQADGNNEDDGFNFLREKKKLSTESEKLLK